MANAALLAIIGLRYLWLYVRLSPSVAWGYALVAYVGHVSALAYLPCLLVLVPVILLSPRPRLVVPLGVVLGGIGGSLLLLDSLVFAENRYHLNVLTFILLAPPTWGFLGLYVVAGHGDRGDAGGLGLAADRAGPGAPHRAVPGAGPGACFVAGHLIHAWAEARYDVPVTSFTRYLPAVLPAQGPTPHVKLGLVDRTGRGSEPSSPPSARRRPASCATRWRPCGASPARRGSTCCSW